MRRFLLLAAAAGILCSCSPPPGSPTDANAEQGNPQAKPEKDVRTKDYQPNADKAGKDVHTELPDKSKRQ